MTTTSFSFPVSYSRNRNHRTHNTVRIATLEVAGVDFPVGLPRGANPRDANINRKVYGEVKDSLLAVDSSHPGTFDLKHRGITIIADQLKITKLGDGRDIAQVTFSEDELQGIVDGGHSAEILETLLGAEEHEIPLDQSVMLEVITGLHTLPVGVLVDIARARNSSTQVAQASLMNLNAEFDFLQTALGARAEIVAWKENDDGGLDVTDLVALMSCFDTVTYWGREQHPVDAERRKKSMLERLSRDPNVYKRLLPILDDILYLSDFIVHDAEDRYGTNQGRNGWSSLGYVRSKSVEHLFLSDRHGEPLTTKNVMVRAALLPVLAAFRGLVVEDTDAEKIGDYYPVKWRTSFDDVLSTWNEVGERLLHHFREAYHEARSDASAAARSKSVWDRCYVEVALATTT